MARTSLPAVWAILVALAALPGCRCCVPRALLTRSETQNRILSEQCRAQLAEIDNLRTHSRQIEDQLMQTERQLAELQEEVGLDARQLAEMRKQRAALSEQFRGLANHGGATSTEVRQRLAALAQRYPELHFDPAMGVAKLQTDILFASGEAELRPAAEKLLAELAEVLNSPEAADLNVLVAGHTDDQQIAKKPARDQFPSNFHLSTARAHAVADFLSRLGFPQQRLAVAGFGANQPIAPNTTAENRRKNRRVEIFVVNPDVPVVGWTDSIPSLY